MIDNDIIMMILKVDLQCLNLKANNTIFFIKDSP